MCGFLSHSIIAEMLEPSLSVLLIYAQREKGKVVVG